MEPEPAAADYDRPLAAYAGLMTLFNVLLGLFLALLKRSNKDLPDRISVGDLLLLGLATHKLSRLIARDAVTSPLRAPFTTYKGQNFGAEVEEEPRGSGLRRAIGELVVCPYCIGQWVAVTAAAGLVVAPRLTRFVASVFGLVAISDLLHIAYEALVDLRQRTGENDDN